MFSLFSLPSCTTSISLFLLNFRKNYGWWWVSKQGARGLGGLERSRVPAAAGLLGLSTLFSLFSPPSCTTSISLYLLSFCKNCGWWWVSKHHGARGVRRARKKSGFSRCCWALGVVNLPPPACNALYFKAAARAHDDILEGSEMKGARI